VPYDQIAMNMERQQRICDGAPFYVLGPLVTDIAAGHDHIACAIGATAAAFHGACLICYVTPAEHLHLPTCDDVREGIMACRIAAHAADTARGMAGARARDDAMSRARAALDWPGQFANALDGTRARERFEAANRDTPNAVHDHCTMCGRDFCAMRVSRALKEAASS
jgi:phosphomethylpyrimidine synthase